MKDYRFYVYIPVCVTAENEVRAYAELAKVEGLSDIDRAKISLMSTSERITPDGAPTYEAETSYNGAELSISVSV